METMQKLLTDNELAGVCGGMGLPVPVVAIDHIPDGVYDRLPSRDRADDGGGDVVVRP